MRFELTGRHVDITPALRKLVDTKLSKLERKLNGGAVSAQAVLTREKFRHRTEITVHARGEKFLHGVGNAPTWEASVSAAIEKLDQQAQKVKGKWQERKRRGVSASVAMAEPAAPPAAPAARTKGTTAAAERVRMPHILRASRQTVKSMTVTDAARAARASRDGVVVFRDAQSAALSVLIHRDGELTLVEAEG